MVKITRMFLEGNPTLSFNRKTFYWRPKCLTGILNLEIIYDYLHIFSPKMDKGRGEKGAILSHLLFWHLEQLSFSYQSTIVTGHTCCKTFTLHLCARYEFHYDFTFIKKSQIPLIIIANSSSFPQLQKFAVPRDLPWYSSCFQSKQWHSGCDLQLAGAWLGNSTTEQILNNHTEFLMCRAFYLYPQK